MRPIDADKLIETIPTVMDMQDAYLPIHFKEWLIDSAPTIDAVSEWIPCSERLPQGNSCEAVLVSVCADDALHDVVFMLARRVEDYYKKGWVNAWMPSPKPWEGAKDETD